MNILVINPPNVPFSSSGILIEPIDVLGVASYIESQGHAVRLLDMDIHKIRPEQFPLHVRGEDYDVAVILYDYHIPLHCDGTLQAVQAIARHVKAMEAKVVVGGKTATYKPSELLFDGSPVDVLLRHEVEPSLKVLLTLDTWTPGTLAGVPSVSYINKEGRIHSTDRPEKDFDLGELPIPDRAFVDLASYIDVRTLLSSRGCHMRCDFCHVPGFWGNWRERSAGTVADEIELLVQQHHAKKILFLDDNAIVNRQRMKELCEILIERNIKVAMGCLGSLDRFDDAMMELMHKAGFRWIHYGVESGDDRLLKTIHKRTDARTALQIVQKTKAIGFRVRTSWIMDLPSSTEGELQHTADLILEMGSEEIRLHHLAIRMGSRIYDDHSDLVSTQYIHQGAQNQNLCEVSPDRIQKTVETVTNTLETRGYAVVHHPDEFIDLDVLTQRSDALKIVSLCPLRYGLGWVH